MRGFATGVGSKADIGAPPLTQLSFMRTRLSVLSQRFVHYTIVFPVSPAGGDAPAMRGHRQALPTPRGGGKSDPKGGLARPPGGTRGVSPRLRYAGDAPAAPGVVARRL